MGSLYHQPSLKLGIVIIHGFYGFSVGFFDTGFELKINSYLLSRSHIIWANHRTTRLSIANASIQAMHIEHEPCRPDPGEEAREPVWQAPAHPIWPIHCPDHFCATLPEVCMPHRIVQIP